MPLAMIERETDKLINSSATQQAILIAHTHTHTCELCSQSSLLSEQLFCAVSSIPIALALDLLNLPRLRSLKSFIFSFIFFF